MPPSPVLGSGVANTRKKKARPFLPWIGFLLLILVAVYVVSSAWAKRSLNESRASVLDRGRPLDIAELYPSKFAETENAALVYEDAVQRLEDTSAGEGQESLFTKLSESAQELLKENPGSLEAFRRHYQSGAVADALAAIKEGSMRPGYWNDLDWSKPLALEMPHLSELMALSRILAATARLQMADGDQAGAWETVATALRLANALEGEPTIVSQLARAASFEQAAESMRRLDPAAVTPARLAEMRGLLRPFDNTAPFIAAFDAERILGEHFFHASASEIEAVTDSGGKGFGYAVLMGLNRVLPPLRSRDRAARTEAMLAYADALAEPYTQADQKLDERIVASIPPYLAITRLTVPAGLGRIKDTMTTMMAETRVLGVGLATLEYRQQHGSYPPDLHALGIADLTDPFTGEDLVFQADATGFSIQSLGANLSHDGSDAEDGDDISWSPRALR